MKTNSLLLLPVLFFTMLSTGCKKDSTTTDNTANTTVKEALINTGTWTITSFTQRTENKTDDFSGMDFTFSSDGKLSVTGSKPANGTWSSSPASTGTATFTINIVEGSTFAKLSRTWKLGSQTSTSLQLNHPETAEDEHVTFTKK